MHVARASKEFFVGYFSTNDRRDKTRTAYVCDMAQFIAFTGDKVDLLSLKNTHIEQWAAHLKNEGYAPASIRRKIVVLKVFFSYWVRQGTLPESPFWRVKINLGRIVQLPRTLSEEEMRSLLNQTQQNYAVLEKRSTKAAERGKMRTSARDYLALRNVALLELLFASGMRVGEVSAVNVRDFLASEGSLRVQGKGGKERLAFIVDKITIRVLNEYLQIRNKFKTESAALFLNASGGRLSSQGIANVIHHLRRVSGIHRHVTPHMLRHTVATLLLRNGVDIRVVQEFLGHASIATTQRYTHVAKDHMIRELQIRHPSLSFRVSE